MNVQHVFTGPAGCGSLPARHEARTGRRRSDDGEELPGGDARGQGDHHPGAVGVLQAGAVAYRRGDVAKVGVLGRGTRASRAKVAKGLRDGALSLMP